jgi:hypothetical protein
MIRYGQVNPALEPVQPRLVVQMQVSNGESATQLDA